MKSLSAAYAALAAMAFGLVSATPTHAQPGYQSRSQRISASKSLPYKLFVPKGYQAGTRYALMITLHGAGERGTDNSAQLVHHFNSRWALDSVQAVRPHFVVAPQCPPNNQWVDTDWSKGSYSQTTVAQSDELKAVVDILDSLGREFTLDPDRIYVSGLSMGGYGTWDLIGRYPQRFAAAVAVCGAGDPSKASSLAALPIWAFHAADDVVVPVSGSRDMVNALRTASGKVQYDEYATTLRIGHASWVPAGNDPRLSPWLFAQTRSTVTLGPSLHHAPRTPGAPLWSPRASRLLFPSGSPRRPRVDGLGRLHVLE
jgi:predicted peptidase